jgi:hypothetical protein
MKALAAVAAFLAVGLMVGCAGVSQTPVNPGYGFIYSDVKAPLQIAYDKTPVSINDKVGQASCMNILGWICAGDASIQAACQEGKITTVHHVDYHFMNFLGIYGNFTTVVYGE